MAVWDLVLAVHILAMALWTGGMAYALLVMRPSAAALAAPDRLAVVGEGIRRFTRLVWVAMPLVVLSGWAMVFGVYGGFAHLPWPVNAMQVIGLVMAALFLLIAFGPARRFRDAPSEAASASVRRLTHANLGLGAIIIVVACFAHW